MKASRMTTEKQWRNIGIQAKRSALPLARVLTGRPSIDALIKEGYDAPPRKGASYITTREPIAPR